MKRFFIIVTIVVTGLANCAILSATNTENQSFSYTRTNGENLMEAITYIISDMFGISQASILPESNFYRDLGLDELDIVHLCIECEDVFDIEISVGSLENIFTVQDLHDIIRPKLYIV